ncbi:MAG: ABC transporter permease [Clostridia bacterium]|nr:ABC transporter permease [Clostridia bacterium]MBQ2306711.1 ABC transporter permease [Clostridia bacterium]MBQ3866998.1 ABC transporter permease [Clostridia bacterium]
MSRASTKEPLIHITRRSTIAPWKGIVIRIAAIVVAFLLCSMLAYFLIGAKPADFLINFFQGLFGINRMSANIRLWMLAKDTAILLLIALALTPAFRMKFWNIGAEGQVLISALAAAAVTYYFGDKLAKSEWLLLLLMLAASITAGIIWAVIPAIFKALWNSNETLFTLMMNYVATYFVAFCLVKWTPDSSSVLGILDHGHLPTLGNDYILILIFTLITTVFMFVYLNYSKPGYEISVVGESTRTARYIGINVKKVIIRTMILTGTICGLTGFLLVAALDHSVTATSVGGLGFTAIIVAWLAKFNPFVMILTSLLLAALNQGAGQITSSFSVSTALPDVMIGIILFFVIGCEFFIRYSIHFRKKAHTSVVQEKGDES